MYENPLMSSFEKLEVFQLNFKFKIKFKNWILLDELSDYMNKIRDAYL